jgi:hypothetical protein
MQRSKGKSAQELLNPDSPDYLGKNIPQYVKTPQQLFKSLMPKKAQAPNMLSNLTVEPGLAPAQAAPTYKAPPKAAPLTRNPGESAADFLKRKKAGG